MNKINTFKNERLAGAILSYIFTSLNLLVNFIYAPVLLKYLGKSEYGLYQMVASFFAYITIFETSISSGVLRYYCNAKAKNDTEAMENVLFISRRIYRIISVILIFFGIVLIAGYTAFYRSSLSDTQLRESIFMLVALIVNMIVSMLNSVYIATITGNERFIFAQSLRIVIQIVQPLLCCLVAIRYPYALTIVIGQLIVNIAAATARRIYAKKSIGIKIIQHQKDSELSKAILVFASSLLISSIADQIFWKADQIIIGKMYSTVLVAIYSIGGQIYNSYQHVGTSITMIFYPQISNLYQEDDALAKISKLFIKVGRIVFFILLIVLSGFAIFGKEFIRYWVGDDYYEAYYVALFVMLPFTIDLVQNIGLSILQVMNKYSFRAKMYFVAAILNIGSTIIMMRYMGIKGAALSTGISMLLTSGFILNGYYIKLGLDIKGFWENIVIILVKLSPLIIMTYFINKLWLENVFGSMWWLAARIVLYSICYLLLVFFVAMNKNEKEIARKFIRRLIKR